MKNRIFAIMLPALALGAIALAPQKAIAALADGSDEEISSIVLDEEISSESLEEISEDVSEIVSAEDGIVYTIKSAFIGYRDDDTASYAEGDSKIGSYFLSADGWKEDETSPIVMTIKGNVTTKLVDKVVYIYEYKPTKVVWNAIEISPNDDKTYTLEKPAEKGEFDLAIYFTKTIITSPVDLVGINWSSLLTVQNLMTIGSWAIIVVGILVLYAINQRYKKKGATTLNEVKTTLTSKVDDLFGKEMSEKFGDMLNAVIAPTFEAIDSKLSKQDNNMATLVRCLLLMQENTPEARLAITKCLSELDTSADGKAEEVKRLIEAEMAKYKAEEEARAKALEEAKAVNNKYKEQLAEEFAEDDAPQEETKSEGDYGAL